MATRNEVPEPAVRQPAQEAVEEDPGDEVADACQGSPLGWRLRMLLSHRAPDNSSQGGSSRTRLLARRKARSGRS